MVDIVATRNPADTFGFVDLFQLLSEPYVVLITILFYFLLCLWCDSWSMICVFSHRFAPCDYVSWWYLLLCCCFRCRRIRFWLFTTNSARSTLLIDNKIGNYSQFQKTSIAFFNLCTTVYCMTSQIGKVWVGFWSWYSYCTYTAKKGTNVKTYCLL